MCLAGPDGRITCRKQEQYIQCSMHVVFVDSVEQLPHLRSVLGRATCVALDVEWRPAGLREPTAQGGKQKPAKQDPAALLQLAVWEGAVCCAVAEAGDGGSAAAGRATVPFGTPGAALLPDLQLPVQTFVIDLLKLGVRFLLRSVSATVSVTVSACMQNDGPTGDCQGCSLCRCGEDSEPRWQSLPRLSACLDCMLATSRHGRYETSV